MVLKSRDRNRSRESVIMLNPARKISRSSIFVLFCLILLFSNFNVCLADQGEVRADLPDNGRVRVVNRLGSVKIETWGE